MLYIAQLAIQMNSVERQAYYGSLPVESREPPPPAAWPWEGEIALEGMGVRYRPGLPLVLRNVTAVINAGEKVWLCVRVENLGVKMVVWLDLGL